MDIGSSFQSLGAAADNALLPYDGDVPFKAIGIAAIHQSQEDLDNEIRLFRQQTLKVTP